ncbi:MAG: ArsB/NhaD family transporter [Gemmatimonadota bacterium]|nr:ArsB/NhaD family transporter [Gemmatimonadota bacterium]
MSQLIVAVVIVATFVLLALEKAHRVLIVIGAVAVLWLFTYLTPWQLITFEQAHAAVDLNVIFLLAGMMAIVAVLKSTGVFSWAVERVMTAAAGRPGRVMVLVASFTALLSAFADNVTTVVFVTPMALAMAKELGVRPVAFLLPMVMAANIGGTATLIGDPPNIMIGSAAGIPFLDFILALAAPCFLMMIWMEWLSARWYRDVVHAPARALSVRAEPISNRPLLRWGLVITGLVFAGFFAHGFTGMPAAVPALIGAAALLVVQDVLYIRSHRPSQAERVHGILDVIEREIEWPTLAFFAFLFIAVGAAVATGLVGTIAQGLAWTIARGEAMLALDSRGTILLAALLILWTSGMLSAVIDNIPFVAVAIPVVAQLTPELGVEGNVLWWALSLGACLGGNASPVGASANVTVVGIAERAGIHIGFREFLRYGGTVTAGTLLIASLWLVSYIYLGPMRTLWIGLLVGALLLGTRLMVGGARNQSPTLHPEPPAANR